MAVRLSTLAVALAVALPAMPVGGASPQLEVEVGLAVVRAPVTSPQQQDRGPQAEMVARLPIIQAEEAAAQEPGLLTARVGPGGPAS